MFILPIFQARAPKHYWLGVLKSDRCGMQAARSSNSLQAAKMKTCFICARERVQTFAHSTCSLECKREYDRRYRARAVMAQCSVCEEWRYTYYNQYSRLLRTKLGACEECPVGSDASKACYEEVKPADDDDDINFKPLGCTNCKFAKLEKASFSGYSCALNAAVCEPRLAQRLYVRSEVSTM